MEILKCGSCGRGITGRYHKQEKKTYYHCTNHGYSCEEKMIIETELSQELAKIIQASNPNTFSNLSEIKSKIENYRELKRIAKQNQRPDVSIRDYATYLLINGNRQDKQKLFENLKGKLLLKNKKVYLNNFLNS